MSARYAGVNDFSVIVVTIGIFLCKVLSPVPYDESGGDTPQNGEQVIVLINSSKSIYSIYMQHSILPVAQALASKPRNNGR